MVIGFNKLGIHWSRDDNYFLNEENQAPGWVWGHFDGYSDELMIFPDSQTISDLERQIYGND
jgi:hypothetical protein